MSKWQPIETAPKVMTMRDLLRALTRQDLVGFGCFILWIIAAVMVFGR